MTQVVELPHSVSILDERGCLAWEVLCFGEELSAEHQAVVRRHIEQCGICAQQQASLSRAAHTVREARPQLLVTTDAKLVARQSALRELVIRRLRNPRQVPDNQVAIRPARRQWYRSRNFWLSFIIASVCLTLAAIATVLIR
jgi:hypothetical protein